MSDWQVIGIQEKAHYFAVFMSKFYFLPFPAIIFMFLRGLLSGLCAAKARLPVSIYKPCGICGDAAPELNAGSCTVAGGLPWAWNLLQMPNSWWAAIIACSTPEFLAALIDGLCQAGLDVVDLGQLPTPMIYYARHRLSADGCAIVTASHNPGNINGLRWMIGNQPPMPDDVYALHVRPKTQTRKSRPTANGSRDRSTFPSTTWPICRKLGWMSMGAQLHIVIDPMHGSWAGKARRYLHAIFPQCLISAINDTPDPAFDGQTPDCSTAAADTRSVRCRLPRAGAFGRCIRRRRRPDGFGR